MSMRCIKNDEEKTSARSKGSSNQVASGHHLFPRREKRDLDNSKTNEWKTRDTIGKRRHIMLAPVQRGCMHWDAFCLLQCHDPIRVGCRMLHSTTRTLRVWPLSETSIWSRFIDLEGGQRVSLGLMQVAGIRVGKWLALQVVIRCF